MSEKKDDALREAVERMTRNVEGLDASADEIERNWPRTSENSTLVAWKRKDAADLRLILSALTAPAVTEEAVEAGARAMISSLTRQIPSGTAFSFSDGIYLAQTSSAFNLQELTRAVLAAAGRGKT